MINQKEEGALAIDTIQKIRDAESQTTQKEKDAKKPAGGLAG